jgi:hypothetical protein
MVYAPPTKTVQDVAVVVKRTFGDESGVQLVDSDILRWVNEAQTEINSKNKVLKKRASLPAVPGQSAYILPSTYRIRQIEGVHFDGSPIKPFTFSQAEQEILAFDPKLEQEGIPDSWYEWAGEITLWPKPNANKLITVYFTEEPEQLTDITDTLSLPDKYFIAIRDYVLAQAYEMDESMDVALRKQEQFGTSVLEMSEEERTSQNMTFQSITLVDYWDHY